MLYIFFFVVVTANAISILTIYMFTRQMFYPWWMWELIFSFYWLTAVFGSLNRRYFDVTKPRSYVWDLRPMIMWTFVIHWASAYALSFAILAPLETPWYIRLPAAYPGTYLLTSAIPIQIAMILYPKHQRRLESQRIKPEKIRAIAEQCPEIREFLRRLPKVQYKAVDNAMKNETAQCIFWHRKSRPERAGLWEDAVICAPVDMKTQKPLCRRITRERYIFQEEEGRSAVLHLSEENLIEDHLNDSPLERDVLEKFDVRFNRFPSLRDAPFSLAVRQSGASV
ncbi:MAG: hypothetical protein JXR73_06560 [Candidatus Omnitrophica bacterium]|nr:hypothetical protein [Candidatus Omnitrophota bacterium]